jgi:hypothetical protein
VVPGRQRDIIDDISSALQEYDDLVDRQNKSLKFLSLSKGEYEVLYCGNWLFVPLFKLDSENREIESAFHANDIMDIGPNSAHSNLLAIVLHRLLTTLLFVLLTWVMDHSPVPCYKLCRSG